VRAAGRAAFMTLSLALAACAGTPWSPAPAVERDRLAAPHRQKARALEQKGDLRRALDEWKLALTISPEDPAAREGRRRLAARLDGAVATRVRLGQEALRRGASQEARRHFLGALVLDPANRTAVAALRAQVGEARLLREPDIAQLRTLDSLSRAPESARAPAETGEEPSDEGLAEINPLLVDARDALERKEHQVALAAVDRLLEGSPRNPEWVDLKKAVLYDYARDRLEQAQYDDAYRALGQLAHLEPRYRDVPALLGQARAGAIQQHYSEGIRLYSEEQLEPAIAQWRAVLEYDPTHAEARRNIAQAERVLRALQERQR
jgi:tetratricopeptide (TPR) repeat protein